MILLIIYAVFGYWATGKTTHANRIFFERVWGEVFIQRVCIGMLFGWALIPIAILRSILGI